MALPPKYLVDPTFGPIPNFPFCGGISKPLPSPGTSGINQSIMFESYAPYIILRFQDINTRGRRSKYTYTITTGSLAGNNRSACIKSMTYSINKTQACNVEIVDTSGDDFANFYASLYKNGCLADQPRTRQNAATNLKIAVDFGWIFTSSSGTTTIYSNTFANKQQSSRKSGPYLYFRLHDIEVDYSGGIWKYKLTLNAPDAQDQFKSASRTVGKENQLVRLIDASSKHLEGDCANPDQSYDVVTTRKNSDGTWSDFKFENSNDKGPKGKWPGYQDTPLNAIRKQLDAVVTDRGRGVFMFYDVSDETQSLFLVEGSFENCRSSGGRNACSPTGSNFLGTYVVNGGDISPVVSFSPQIKFVATPQNNTGSVATGSFSPRAFKIKGCENKDPKANEGATIVTNAAIREQQLNTFPPGQIGEKISKATRAHIEAEKTMIQSLGQITGDLVIQGDPRLVWPTQVIASRCSIIFVNPFSLKQSFPAAGRIDANWLVNQPTNGVLSKADVLVNGAEHTISEGKWETKLNVVYFPNATANAASGNSTPTNAGGG